MTKVMVPLDGSALAEQAVPYAAALARATGGRLLLVRATLSYVAEAIGAEETIVLHPAARLDLEGAATRARSFGLPVETHLVGGIGAAATLVAAAARLRADLIVMSTHGRGGVGRFLYGSVADDVLRHAHVPVVVVPASVRAAWPTAGKLRVLVPLDGSELAAQALEPVASLARSTPTEVVLAQVVPTPGASAAQLGFPPTYALPTVPDPAAELAAARAGLEERAARLVGSVAVAGVRVEIGEPAATLVELARAERVHLVAMSTHGRGGLTRLVMGSVATGVVQHAAVPVLLMPAGARAALAPEMALPAGRSAGGPATVTLGPNELALALYGLEMVLHAAERDQALTEPVQELIGKLTRAGAPPAPPVAAAG